MAKSASTSGISHLNRLNLPGWDLPLPHYDADKESPGIDTGFRDVRDPFPGELGGHSDGCCILDESRDWSQLRRTQLEITMIQIIHAITDKPRWASKIWDESIRQRWSREIQSALAAADTRFAEQSRHLRNGPFYWGPSIDEKAASFILDELLYKSQSDPDLTTVLGLGGADIVKSDTLVPEAFRQELVSLVEELEGKIPVDWQPGREACVRNIIHPSMYPLCFGSTKLLPDKIDLVEAYERIGEGQVIAEPSPATNYSTQFQWLPAEVVGDRGFVQFTSYINNLDPVHEGAYLALGELVKYSIPLWNKCLAHEKEDAPRRVPCHDEESLWTVDENREPAPPPYDDETGDSRSKRNYTKAEAVRSLQRLGQRKWYAHEWHWLLPVLIWPQPETFSAWSARLNSEVVSRTGQTDLYPYLRRTGLQIIVKIASIHLSPEQLAFSGGAMHVEGMANEHICATSIYYYDTENVKKPQIAFSGGAHMGQCSYSQDDYMCLEHVYGTSLRETPATQHFANVDTPQGRLLAFPNVFQHQLLPFELHDKTKPGHRKMVVLWLVNPQKRIISTAHVPPQQPQGAHALSLDEAKAVRLRLMEERGHDTVRRQVSQQQYCFCEH